jgi:hypothetical protein
MLDTLELLNKYKIAKSYEIQDFRQGPDFYFLKVRADLSNNTILYVREYVSEDGYHYSYHWQEENGTLLVRCNAPHHRRLKTFPHHKHVGEQILPSYEITLGDVMKYIVACVEER